MAFDDLADELDDEYCRDRRVTLTQFHDEVFKFTRLYREKLITPSEFVNVTLELVAKGVKP